MTVPCPGVDFFELCGASAACSGPATVRAFFNDRVSVLGRNTLVCCAGALCPMKADQLGYGAKVFVPTASFAPDRAMTIQFSYALLWPIGS
jgi:hypothetical protein